MPRCSALWESALSNREAWAAYEALLADDRVMLQADEPPGIEARWRELTLRDTASPKLWTDAYLAAFSIAAGYRMVTTDAAFGQFPVWTWCWWPEACHLQTAASPRSGPRSVDPGVGDVGGVVDGAPEEDHLAVGAVVGHLRVEAGRSDVAGCSCCQAEPFHAQRSLSGAPRV